MTALFRSYTTTLTTEGSLSSTAGGNPFLKVNYLQAGMAKAWQPVFITLKYTMWAKATPRTK